MLKLSGVLAVTAALGVLATPQPGLQAAEPSPRALVVINGYDHDGQYLETSNGFVVAGGFLFASFQAIHHASRLEVERIVCAPLLRLCVGAACAIEGFECSCVCSARQ